jgi:hypothetical protein
MGWAFLDWREINFPKQKENSVSRLSTFPAIPNPIHPIRQRKDAELPGLGIVILAEQDASPSGVRLNASLVPNCHI